MSSITEDFSDSKSLPKSIHLTTPSTSTTEPTPITSTTMTTTPDTITSRNPQRKPKSYGNLTSTLHDVKSFIKKAVKDDKADRLSRKELDKVAIAKMRLGVEEYNEMLDSLLKDSDFQRERLVSEELRDVKGDDIVGNEVEGEVREEGKVGVAEDEVSNEELEIVSLKRQLACMRRRS